LKNAMLLLVLLLPSFGQAQDCYNCMPSLNYGPEVPEWPIEYSKIEKVNYQRNTKASFCKRPVEIVDTIVLHHSETPSTDSPERINEFHLARGTKEDPWYMIAYSYVINTPYAGASTPRARVTEGRPLDIVGAHAGSNVFVPMDAEQKKMFDDGKVTCGKEDGDFKPDPTLIQNGKIKANVTTIGLVVFGNYSPFSKSYPNGYSKKNPRYPTKQTQDMIARMSCQLQKKYPRMKNIKWHNFYHSTSCPGTIKDYIGQIKALARKYGCEFN
jgi:hypothetical protein